MAGDRRQGPCVMHFERTGHGKLREVGVGEDKTVIVHESRIEMHDRSAAGADPLGDTFPGIFAVLHKHMVADTVEVPGIHRGRLIGLDDAPPSDLGRRGRLSPQHGIRGLRQGAQPLAVSIRIR